MQKFIHAYSNMCSFRIEENKKKLECLFFGRNNLNEINIQLFKLELHDSMLIALHVFA